MRSSTSGPPALHVRRLDELVDGGGAERAFELLLDLAEQPALDLAAQLVERVELACGLRQLVVERRQHALLDLLDGDGRRALRAVRELVGDLALLAGRQTAHTVLDLLDETLRAELDDVVALGGAVVRDEVDDDGVALLRRGAPRRGSSSATVRCSASSSACTASCGTSASCFGTSSFVQSAGSGFGCTSTVAEKRQSS